MYSMDSTVHQLFQCSRRRCTLHSLQEIQFSPSQLLSSTLHSLYYWGCTGSSVNIVFPYSIIPTFGIWLGKNMTNWAEVIQIGISSNFLLLLDFVYHINNLIISRMSQLCLKGWIYFLTYVVKYLWVGNFFLWWPILVLHLKMIRMHIGTATSTSKRFINLKQLFQHFSF